MPDHSNFVVYVDESGDHSLTSIDPHYPVFVLAFCVFRKEDYAGHILPAVTRFKFKYFGHDMVILHEREIRKAQPPFGFLTDADVREEFFEDLQELVADAPFEVIASVIDKEDLTAQYVHADNPYELALAFNLERLAMHLSSTRTDKRVHIVVEGRGAKEDADLELAFRRVCDGANLLREALPFELVFADKQVNSSGLQFADLIARPIGRNVMDPAQPNRAYEVIEKKLRRSRDGKVEGWGLKVFP